MGSAGRGVVNVVDRMRWRSLLSFRRAPWLRPLPVFALVAFGVARHRENVDPLAPTPSDALAEALAARGLSCAASDVFWLRGPSGALGAFSGGGRAIVRAHAGSDAN